MKTRAQYRITYPGGRQEHLRSWTAVASRLGLQASPKPACTLPLMSADRPRGDAVRTADGRILLVERIA